MHHDKIDVYCTSGCEKTIKHDQEHDPPSDLTEGFLIKNLMACSLATGRGF